MRSLKASPRLSKAFLSKPPFRHTKDLRGLIKVLWGLIKVFIGLIKVLRGHHMALKGLVKTD